MSYFADINERIDALRLLLGDVERASDLPTVIDALDDAAAVHLVALGAHLARSANQLCTIGAAVISRRSERGAGTQGIAQAHGHRSTLSLMQELTGGSRADATKQLRVGESLLASAAPEASDAPTGDVTQPATPAMPSAVWHRCLSQAVLTGALSAAQHDAIRRGLGEPPIDADDEEASASARDAWSVAAEQLAREARERTVEELLRTARTVRDQLDPAGARERFEARYAARSFRSYTDADGVHHAHLVCEDEGFAWIRAIVDAALRPRRGGPRFVDSAEQQRAERLHDDPRTNDQLAYDLILDVLRAGALADAESVFGTRQAGVRIVHVADAERMPTLEDDGSTLPDWLVATHTCDTGERHITIDAGGNPLNVGRERRLFTSPQRVALAARDGGCRWRGCDRPASYCEAHHIDHWDADGGRTDVDRGILLCRFHHMTLHNGGWRVSREGKGDFLLHPPGDAPPIALRARLGLSYTWGVDPPPPRFQPAA